MKILYFTSSEADYLSDSLLLGLRKLYGADCVDYPRADFLYADCLPIVSSRIRGHGFTLYTGILEEINVDRSQLFYKMESGFYDLIVFSDAWKLFGYFLTWRMYLNPSNTVFLDGQDTPQVYSYAGRWWRYPYCWTLPRAEKGFLYFKREWTPDSQFNLWHRFIPQAWRRFLTPYSGLRTTAFSIPDEKILTNPPVKSKEFAKHVVDPEVAAALPESSIRYAFTDEREYYEDLQNSRYAITTKRAGWDCLRHYEIAANGCVPCFRNLQDKPKTCAPHGLVDGVNCVDYNGYEDLMLKLGKINESLYQTIVSNALAWARENSCRRAAERLVGEWRSFSEKGNSL